MPPGQQVPPPGFAGPPPKPKKKGRPGCIVAAILVAIPVLLIGVTAGGYFYIMHQRVTAPAGSEPSGEPMTPECDLLSATTLRELHTTNFLSGTTTDSGWVNCMWKPTKGQDGTNERRLDIIIADNRDYSDPVEETEASFDSQRESETDAVRINDVSGPWDAGFLVGHGSSYEGKLVFRKGAKLVSVSISGTDKSYWHIDGERMPIDEAEAAAKKVAEEIAPKL
jgi:hypothetical protein